MLQGVVLLLFCKGQLFFIREKRTKPLIGKRAGMLAVPMETMELAETPDQAIWRLLLEEVGLLGLIELHLIGQISFSATETTVAYKLFIYFGVSELCDPITVNPKDSEDVEVVGWLPVTQLRDLGEKGRRELPAIWQLLQTYLAANTGGKEG